MFIKLFKTICSLIIDRNRKKECYEEPIAKVSRQLIPKNSSRLARIKDMEERYERVKAALDELETTEEHFDLSEDINVLREYYESGRWQRDFTADERGKLPKDLKRGVLSEDGLWNLLEEVDDRLE